LRWIGRPLSATDLSYVFDCGRVGQRIERHLQRLAKLGAVAPADRTEPRNGALRRPYLLAALPRR
jgi:hypothetical protein